MKFVIEKSIKNLAFKQSGIRTSKESILRLNEIVENLIWEAIKRAKANSRSVVFAKDF